MFKNLKVISKYFISAFIVLTISVKVGSLFVDWIYFEPVTLCTGSALYAYLKIRDSNSIHTKEL